MANNEQTQNSMTHNDATRCRNQKMANKSVNRIEQRYYNTPIWRSRYLITSFHYLISFLFSIDIARCRQLIRCCCFRVTLFLYYYYAIDAADIDAEPLLFFAYFRC